MGVGALWLTTSHLSIYGTKDASKKGPAFRSDGKLCWKSERIRTNRRMQTHVVLFWMTSYTQTHAQHAPHANTHSTLVQWCSVLTHTYTQTHTHVLTHKARSCKQYNLITQGTLLASLGLFSAAHPDMPCSRDTTLTHTRAHTHARTHTHTHAQKQYAQTISPLSSSTF